MYYTQVKLEEFQEPYRLEPTFLTTQHKPEPKEMCPKKLEARKILGPFQLYARVASTNEERFMLQSILTQVKEKLTY